MGMKQPRSGHHGTLRLAYCITILELSEPLCGVKQMPKGSRRQNLETEADEAFEQRSGICL